MTEQDLDALIPDQWYPLEQASAVKSKRPLGIRRFGQDLVLWRSGDRILCMPDRCSHRGAALSRGRVHEGCLVCPYHALHYDHEGRCVKIPADPEGRRISPNLRQPPFPVREKHGFVWMWWGKERETYPEVPWFDEVPTSLRDTHTLIFDWKANFNRVMESMFDIHHIPFVHKKLARNMGTVLEPFSAEREGDLVRTWGHLRDDATRSLEEEPGTRFEVSVRFPSVTLWYTPRTPKFWLVAVVSPIDLERSWVAFRYYQAYVPLPVLGPLSARFSATVEKGFLHPDDQKVFETLRPAVPEVPRNNFIQADRGIALWLKTRREALAAVADEETAPRAAAATGVQ